VEVRVKLVVVHKHCAVRYDRRAREYKISKTTGVTVLVWSKTLHRYVKSDRSVLEVACPCHDCKARIGKPCTTGGQHHGWTHYQRRRAATTKRTSK
jgi:hypothetical protein